MGKLSATFGSEPPFIPISFRLNSARSIDLEDDHNELYDDIQDIQSPVFEGYEDRNNHITKITEFMNMLTNASKLKLNSFKTMDPSLSGNEENDHQKYFNLLSKHFETRHQKLMQLKKSSYVVLSNSMIN